MPAIFKSRKSVLLSGHHLNISFLLKISAFSASGLVATKKITGRVDEKGLLAVLPDPILCYKNARYHQKQVTITYFKQTVLFKRK